jgi:hypothetical protein
MCVYMYVHTVRAVCVNKFLIWRRKFVWGDLGYSGLYHRTRIHVCTYRACSVCEHISYLAWEVCLGRCMRFLTLCSAYTHTHTHVGSRLHTCSRRAYRVYVFVCVYVCTFCIYVYIHIHLQVQDCIRAAGGLTEPELILDTEFLPIHIYTHIHIHIGSRLHTCSRRAYRTGADIRHRFSGTHRADISFIAAIGEAIHVYMYVCMYVCMYVYRADMSFLAAIGEAIHVYVNVYIYVCMCIGQICPSLRPSVRPTCMSVCVCVYSCMYVYWADISFLAAISEAIYVYVYM